MGDTWGVDFDKTLEGRIGQGYGWPKPVKIETFTLTSGQDVERKYVRFTWCARWHTHLLRSLRSAVVVNVVGSPERDDCSFQRAIHVYSDFVGVDDQWTETRRVE